MPTTIAVSVTIHEDIGVSITCPGSVRLKPVIAFVKANMRCFKSYNASPGLLTSLLYDACCACLDSETTLVPSAFATVARTRRELEYILAFSCTALHCHHTYEPWLIKVSHSESDTKFSMSIIFAWSDSYYLPARIFLLFQRKFS